MKVNELAALPAQIIEIRNDPRFKGNIEVKVHIPEEGGSILMAALPHWPSPKNPVPIAVAMLDLKAVDVPPSAPRETGEERPVPTPVSRLPGPFAREAGMLCNDPDFWDFLQEHFPHEWSILNTGKPAEKAAVILRKECGDVESRSDIRHGPSGDSFNRLKEWFLGWLDDRQQEQQRREYEESEV